MKELSIEEKAKAYDKALQVLHKYDGANIMFSQSLKEEMFPELKESEDKKWIPKEIANYLKEKGDFRSCWIAWLEKQGEQKDAWSEEDETKIKSIIAFLKSPALCAMDGNKGIIDENIKYLKSLKERVGCEANCTTTKELSEEDKNRFNNLIFLVECSKENDATKEGFIRFINKIKSLRPQSHWKPSERQKEALLWCVVHLGGADKQALGELLEELNKL